MKKSGIYYMAQSAVLTDDSIAVDARLEILRELMRAEDMERLIENRAEETTDEAVS